MEQQKNNGGAGGRKDKKKKVSTQRKNYNERKVKSANANLGFKKDEKTKGRNQRTFDEIGKQSITMIQSTNFLASGLDIIL